MLSARSIGLALEVVKFIALLSVRTPGFTAGVWITESTDSIGSLPGSGSAWLKPLAANSHVNKKRIKWIGKCVFIDAQLSNKVDCKFESTLRIKYDL